MAEFKESMALIATQLDWLEERVRESLALIEAVNRDATHAELAAKVHGKEWPADTEEYRVALGLVRRFRRDLEQGQASLAELERIQGIVVGLLLAGVDDD